MTLYALWTSLESSCNFRSFFFSYFCVIFWACFARDDPMSFRSSTHTADVLCESELYRFLFYSQRFNLAILHVAQHSKGADAESEF